MNRIFLTRLNIFMQGRKRRVPLSTTNILRNMFSATMNIWKSIGAVALLILVVPCLAAARGPAPAPRITSQIDEAGFTKLLGNTHPLARRQNDQGAVADSQPIRRVLLLLQRSPVQETALKQFMDQQQSKASPNFHRWLTPQQFGQQFGPADSDVQIVIDWLRSQGFQVARVSNGRALIEFSGTAGQIRAAFRTEIHRYVVNGHDYFANSSDPKFPPHWFRSSLAWRLCTTSQRNRKVISLAFSGRRKQVDKCLRFLHLVAQEPIAARRIVTPLDRAILRRSIASRDCGIPASTCM